MWTGPVRGADCGGFSESVFAINFVSNTNSLLL
jgi:hypothetical protein